MHKKILLFLCAFLIVQTIKAQLQYVVPANKCMLLTIPDPSIISWVVNGKPIFTIPGMNAIINQYSVAGFKKVYPYSRFPFMRSIYQIYTNDTSLGVQLTSTYPAYFPHWEYAPPPQPLSFTPDDYGTIPGQRNTGFLDYIHAEDAWGVTQGDSTRVIGILDFDVNPYHGDLILQFERMEDNIISGPDHGTIVSGLLAARTHNGFAYPGIGFRCKLDYVGLDLINKYYGTQLMEIANRNRKIINYSAIKVSDMSLYGGSYSISEQGLFQELYEKGIFFVAGAGNGYRGSTPSYRYCRPASYDYVFSVSGVGWENSYGGTIDSNIKGIHEKHIGDTFSTFQHNSQVDLLAPSFDLGGLVGSNGYTYGGNDGTSGAAPLAAGTAGLILSVDSCYTPYQLEYILKKSADDSVLYLSENLKYAGKLGAGALDAGGALAMVNTNPNVPTPPGVVKTNCNDPATQTMFIDGIEINTICAPGHGSGVKPQLTPILRNGNPPYTYRWEYMTGNNTTLSSLNVSNPQITSSTGNHIAYYRLTVYDGSDVQKIASKYFKIQLSTAPTYDLTGIDSYMDMGNEPNDMEVLDPREDWYVESPDLWNRLVNDAGKEHQNPEYYQNNFNYAKVKIRNIGCAPYTGGANLKLYWTVAATGEDWSDDWNGTTTIGPNPGGGELTQGAGISIPALQPGHSTTITKNWSAPKPQDYGTNNLNVCLLARIVDPSAPLNETLNTNVLQNVKANNGIYTRNLWVQDLNPHDKPSVDLRSYIANAEDDAGLFDIQFITERDVHRHFAGNFSAVGRVTIYLGELYDLWMDAGGEGTYLSRNPETKTVVYDGSTPLELLDIELPPDERFPVDIEFSLLPDAVIPEYTYFFRLRQFAKMGPQERLPNVYGGMGFKIHTTNEEEPRERPAISNDIISRSSSFSLHPNPAHDFIKVSYLNNQLITANVTIYDIMGRKMAETKNRQFQNSYVELSTSELVPGVYFVEITNNKGVNEKLKFVKQ